jgi:hypothetical protein
MSPWFAIAAAIEAEGWSGDLHSITSWNASLLGVKVWLFENFINCPCAIKIS